MIHSDQEDHHRTGQGPEPSQHNTDKYERYAQVHAPEWVDEPSTSIPKRGKRKTKPPDKEVIASLTDEAVGLEAGFETTYRPARFEREWLLDSLRYFYTLDLITDVLAQVKGGKEANVYRCRANQTTGLEFVAAKVYRPRKFRNLRNDKLYREGRDVLGITGRPFKPNDLRVMRALDKKTSFGSQVAHTSWLMHEFTTLERLHQAGIAVPKPLSSYDNAILMGYIGDEQIAAPTLHEVQLESSEATVLFDEVLGYIEQMLALDTIHGDLSAYNILYWQGQPVIIDFPQVTNSRTNSRARFILERDVERICDYFALQGVIRKPGPIAASLWHRYSDKSENDLLADFSRHVEAKEAE